MFEPYVSISTVFCMFCCCGGLTKMLKIVPLRAEGRAELYNFDNPSLPSLAISSAVRFVRHLALRKTQPSRMIEDFQHHRHTVGLHDHDSVRSCSASLELELVATYPPTDGPDKRCRPGSCRVELAATT
jgi:hypothetical protein